MRRCLACRNEKRDVLPDATPDLADFPAKHPACPAGVPSDAPELTRQTEAHPVPSSDGVVEQSARPDAQPAEAAAAVLPARHSEIPRDQPEPTASVAADPTAIDLALAKQPVSVAQAAEQDGPEQQPLPQVWARQQPQASKRPAYPRQDELPAGGGLVSLARAVGAAESPAPCFRHRQAQRCAQPGARVRMDCPPQLQT